jgi:hypothetical protein
MRRSNCARAGGGGLFTCDDGRSSTYPSSCLAHSDRGDYAYWISDGVAPDIRGAGGGSHSVVPIGRSCPITVAT